LGLPLAALAALAFGHPWPSMAIHGHPWPSMAISHQATEDDEDATVRRRARMQACNMQHAATTSCIILQFSEAM